MALGRLLDANGDPVLFRADRVDPASPDMIYDVQLFIKPGGMIVAKALDPRPITVADVPRPISVEEAEQERAERIAQHHEHEREAALAEAEARATKRAKK